MKVPHLIRIILLVALLLSVYTLGSASALEGQVVEVVDGGTITVISLKRPVKVRLIGMAALDPNQPYADVARQHLSDLILNKYVVVRYSRLQDGYLVGKVLLGDMDVGAQMIRDGVAWYDKPDERHLENLERQLYDASEQAARNERRGLWHDESPIAPWEFRKAQLARLNPTPLSLPRPQTLARRGNQAGLSSDDLMGGVVGPGSIAGQPTFKRISPDGAPGEWVRYQPEGRHFSILAPSDGVELSYPVLDGQTKVVELHYVIGDKDGNLYVMMWARGSNDNATDASAAADTIKGLVAGINRSIERTGQGFVVTANRVRDLTLSGYTGKQYKLSGGPASGAVRVFTKQLGDQRELFMLCVLNGPAGDSSDDQFLNSFKISQSARR
jgi:endonuclease YncB( thermonuclease family)